MQTPAEPAAWPAPMSTAERLRHASSFGPVAAAYADHRPSYADEAIRWSLAPLATAVPRVVDVGAGTGILTAALIRLGADVTAVEPDPEMLAELRRRVPGARAGSGSAEALPLPDASVDAVLAGQAMHWFDLERALPEIARVLVPGGVLAGLWNVDDDRIGWVHELAEMSRRKASNTLLRWRNGAASPRPEQIQQAGAGLFGPIETGEFPNGQVRTADSLVASIATHSNLLIMDTAERQALLAQVSGFLREHEETSAGEFTLPLLTIVTRLSRLPLPPA
jgi:SAM-dependent methyltransferase